MSSRAGIKHWTRQEDERLRELWAQWPKIDVQKAFPRRTWSALGQRARHLGLRRNWKWVGRYKPPADEIMEALRERRQRLGYTGADISRMIGLHSKAVPSHERGRFPPTYLGLLRWCEALGMKLKVEKVGEQRG